MGSGASTSAMDISSAVHQLVQGFRQHGPTEALLPLIRRAFVVLKLKAADRSYRYNFTENYMALLGQSRSYQPQLLDAALVQSPDLWVNGSLYHIAPATLQKGRMLKRCFLQICDLLNLESEDDIGVLLCSRLARALSVFDSQWVQFEELYIKDLIRIETRARVPLEKAVEMEIVLLNFEHAKPAKPKESSNSVKHPVVEQSVHHLPVPRRRHTASDASGRVAAAAGTAGTAGTGSSHGTQLSLPRHSRHVPGSSSSPPSNLHSREESIVFPEGSECPRSRQHTLSGELPSMAMACHSVLPEPQEAPKRCELKHLAQSAVARGSTR